MKLANLTRDSPINFTPNPCASPVERLVKNETFSLKFSSSAFLRCLWWGPRQRPLARWFHPRLWLVHLNFSASGPLNLSARSNFKWTFLNGSFDPRKVRIWSEIYWAFWNFCFYCDSGLFPLRRKRFVEWRLASDVQSGLPLHSFRRRSNGFK